MHEISNFCNKWTILKQENQFFASPEKLQKCRYSILYIVANEGKYWNHFGEFDKWATTWQNNKMTVCPTKTQITLSIRPVLSEASLCTQWVAKEPSFLHADSKDSDQTGPMHRLIFAGHTCHFIRFVMRRLKFENFGSNSHPMHHKFVIKIPWKCLLYKTFRDTHISG